MSRAGHQKMPSDFGSNCISLMGFLEGSLETGKPPRPPALSVVHMRLLGEAKPSINQHTSSWLEIWTVKLQFFSRVRDKSQLWSFLFSACLQQPHRTRGPSPALFNTDGISSILNKCFKTHFTHAALIQAQRRVELLGSSLNSHPTSPAPGYLSLREDPFFAEP